MALAQSSDVLIAGRALQGLGAALVSPAALAIVTTTFAEGAERTKALGVWSAIAAGGAAAGLVIGGLLTETLSWRWIFFVNLPIGIVAALLSLRFVPNSRPEDRPETYDAAGAVTVTGGLLVLVYAIVKAQGYGWGSSKTAGLFVLAFVLLAAFVVIERRSKAPLIRLDIFRMRSLSGSNVAMLLVASGLFAMFYFASLYMQEILGYGPLKAGVAFVPFTVGIIVGAGASQALIRRIGIRIVVFTGITMGTAGLLYFARLPAHGSYVPDLLPTIAIVSIGMGMTFVPLTLLATTNVEFVGRRSRVGALQHVATGRRRTGTRDPLDAGRLADEQPPWARRAVVGSRAGRGPDERLPPRFRRRRSNAAGRARRPRSHDPQAGCRVDRPRRGRLDTRLA